MFANAQKALPTQATSDSVDDAIKARHAVRRFRAEPVAIEVVREILDVARYAPSGSNIQPWRVWVVSGAARDRLCSAAVAAFLSTGPRPEEEEFKYYPETFPEVNLARRMAFGAAFGGAMGVAQDDIKGRMQVMARQFQFFDAPIGLIFTMDRRLEHGSFLDYGCFLQSIMIAAKSRGLDTCSQQSWCQFHPIIRDELGIPESEMLICGMSLGWADEKAPENNMDMIRASIEDFATFCE